MGATKFCCSHFLLYGFTKNLFSHRLFHGGNRHNQPADLLQQTFPVGKAFVRHRETLVGLMELLARGAIFPTLGIIYYIR